MTAPSGWITLCLDSYQRRNVAMAPTNRLIEARRAELRAEADKKREGKVEADTSLPKSPGRPPKTHPTSKA